MRGAFLGFAAVLALALTACETPGPKIPTAPPSRNAPRPRPVPPPAAPKPAPSVPAPTPARPVPAPRPVAPQPEPEYPPPGSASRLQDLPGWAGEDHVAALKAYQAGCAADRSAAEICRRAQGMTNASDEGAKHFLEDNFRLAAVGNDPGLLTAYFAPEYEARSYPDAEFSAPVRPRPADLNPDRPYADRAAIEARPTDDALAWMRPEDLFFLQIQGSGTLIWRDGRSQRASFAGHNGRPFAGIAIPMRQRGLLADNDTSGEAIRAWLSAHAGPEAAAIMRLNPRYVFFSLGPDNGDDPAGAAGIPLPAGRSIAVDPSFHTYGAAYWIDGSAPVLNGAFPSYRRLVMALDTGGAIRGAVRADLYMGRGSQAGAEAGRVRHTLRMYRLVPVDR